MVTVKYATDWKLSFERIRLIQACTSGWIDSFVTFVLLR